jgi:hypothetical protein
MFDNHDIKRAAQGHDVGVGGGANVADVNVVAAGAEALAGLKLVAVNRACQS